MTDVHQALHAFWSSFGVPAYLSGHVPDGASLPYITFEVGDALRNPQKIEATMSTETTSISGILTALGSSSGLTSAGK